MNEENKTCLECNHDRFSHTSFGKCCVILNWNKFYENPISCYCRCMQGNK
jgi:hypothetical protein